MVGSPSVDTSEELSSPNRESERINSTPPAKRSSTTNTATTINTAYLVRGFFGFSSGSSGLRGRLGAVCTGSLSASCRRALTAGAADS